LSTRHDRYEEAFIPGPLEIAFLASRYFARNKEQTAKVLAGPKRETWFSAETFVALHSATGTFVSRDSGPRFSCWGEDQFSSVFERVNAGVPETDGVGNKPDIVCYRPDDGVGAVEAILELKLLLNDESPTSSLKKLKEQVLTARQLFPKTRALGLIFIAAVPFLTPGTFDRNIDNAKHQAELILPPGEGFSWVYGHDFARVFDVVSTGFYYPAMHVSLALGVRELTCPQV